ncbi:MAG: ABC transporter permease, partial [Clostridium sp.]|nr:ABC transporter permease [Clostridium sp.]
AFTDIFLSIPFLPIVILMGSMLSDLKVNPNMRIVALMFMLGLLSWPSIARLVRGEILSLREQEFMQATESLGLKDTRKILKHLIPNVIPTIIVNATLGVASAILTESALSYLGMGVVEPTPSWGNMISASNKAIDLQKRPWLWMPPGACMVITVMAVNLFGDALRDALDPKKRR